MSLGGKSGENVLLWNLLSKWDWETQRLKRDLCRMGRGMGTFGGNMGNFHSQLVLNLEWQ
jgi:hypothetical protein